MAKASRLADNKVAESDWDNDLLKSSIDSLLETIGNDDIDLQSFGFDMSVFDDLIQPEVVEKQNNNYSTVRENKVYDNDDIENVGSDSYESKLDEDKLDEVPEIESIETRVKSGDIWQLGKHYLLCGDCTIERNIRELVGGNKIDMVFTDPPYGVSYADKNRYLNTIAPGNRIQVPIENDHLDIDGCKELWINAFKTIGEYFNEYSSYYVTSPQGGDLYLMMMMMIKEAGWQLKHNIIWNKNNHVLGRCDYNYKHEPIIYGWKNKHKFYGNGHFKTSVWDIPKPQKSELHPTMKPIELVENCILNSTEEKMIVADPFLGSGTTLIACEKTNRICYGTELSPKYCDVILTRWEKLTGNT
ncbi:MAG TPA: site-specific DNA-methyltransferase, partial [Allocoleopsis sp.]